MAKLSTASYPPVPHQLIDEFQLLHGIEQLAGMCDGGVRPAVIAKKKSAAIQAPRIKKIEDDEERSSRSKD